MLILFVLENFQLIYVSNENKFLILFLSNVIIYNCHIVFYENFNYL